jgi:hypothetical protein
MHRGSCVKSVIVNKLGYWLSQSCGMQSDGAITVKVKTVLVIHQQYLYVAYYLLLENI